MKYVVVAVILAGCGGSKGAELPAVCTELKTAMDKVATCSEMPQSPRDLLKKHFDRDWARWSEMSADEHKAAKVETSCKAELEALRRPPNVCKL
jgi:hypothetical protein